VFPDLLREDFVWRALLGGLGVAVVAGPLGCFVVWRRMAFVGAAISHAALLGVALGLLLGANLTLGILAAGGAAAAGIAALEERRGFSGDALLGIVAHATLAVGLVVLAFLEGVRVDLMGYLFGDILAVTRGDLLWIYGGGAAALAVLAAIWRPLLAVTIQKEVAEAEGVREGAVRLAFLLLIALVVAIAMKVVGVLLVHALLIIPAAAARPFARTPEGMAGLAVGAGTLSVLGGLWASFRWDTPSGPSVVAAATVLFLASLAAGALRRRAAG